MEKNRAKARQQEGQRHPGGARWWRHCRFGRTESTASGTQGLGRLGLERRVGRVGGHLAKGRRARRRRRLQELGLAALVVATRASGGAG
jgi:hypothetical protein